MVTKRMRPKKRERNYYEEGEKEKIGRDNAPKETGSDMPKKFARILDFEKNYVKKPKQKNQVGLEKHTLGLKIQPGENLKAFNHRVNMILGNPAQDTPSAPSQKKEKRKLKRAEKRQVIEQARAEEASCKDFHKLSDKVKFGEVAMAPPIFTSKPKDRAKNKRDALASLASSLQDTPAPTPKAKKYIKTPAERRILEAERTKLVGIYRKLKSDRRQQQQ